MAHLVFSKDVVSGHHIKQYDNGTCKRKTLEDALRITDDDIADALGGLPEHKLHSSVLGATALKNAIVN